MDELQESPPATLPPTVVLASIKRMIASARRADGFGAAGITGVTLDAQSYRIALDEYNSVYQARIDPDAKSFTILTANGKTTVALQG